ncbi:MAG: dihydropteroate synthase [Prevotella sp.]|nr:dihydropteroate synthase [Prevotella sp.]MDY6409391.1 dihydropteroate synthase [Prevotella sp.]
MTTGNSFINIRGRLVSTDKPMVMGILNVTPDSFFSGSRKQSEHEIAERANAIVSEGGNIIDVGAFSTRPGANEVSEQEEMTRMRMGLEIVRRQQPNAIVSVDTYRPDVARMCVEEYGADIINDVSEGGITGIANVSLEPSESETPAIFRTVAELGVPYILMSVRNDIQTMLLNAAKEVSMLRQMGVKDIIFDPGFGFGKTLEENYEIMKDLEKLHVLQLPLLVGISRKSMISRLFGTDADHALNGTTALNTIALMKGAAILRVHDVKEAVETLKICELTRQSNCTGNENKNNDNI